MKKGLTEVVFILDRSGSMRGLEADTIGGFNSMIERQKKEDGEANISTILFDDQVEVLYDRVPVEKVEPMNDRQYYVRGCTALLDAIGSSIHHIKSVHKEAGEDERPEKTVMIITTDGMENASRKYDYGKVKKMVKKAQEKYGWEFLFLGANMDAISVAGQFGIAANRAVNYECDQAGTALNFKAVSKALSGVRKAKSSMEMGMMMDACCEEISEDYKKRHQN